MKQTSPLKIMGLAATLLLGTSSLAFATPSGTSITNSVNLSYQTGGNTISVNNAASVTFVVDTGVDLLVEGRDAGNSVTATQGKTGAVLTYRVQNLSNATFDFDIDVARTGNLGLTYDATGAGTKGTYFVAYGTSPTYAAGTATVFNTAGVNKTISRTEGQDFYVYVVSSIPDTAIDGRTDTFEVKATVLNATTGAKVTELRGQGAGTVDIVFDDPNTDGTEKASENLVVTAPNLTAVKTQAVISENLTDAFNCATGTAVSGSEAFIPGACVEYTITVTNGTGATASATNLVFTDALPANTTYAAHNKGTFDTATNSNGTITASKTTLAAGASAAFTVRATIN
jgi:uncharacterized repeat protein (TIGR01451 family)